MMLYCCCLFIIWVHKNSQEKMWKMWAQGQSLSLGCTSRQVFFAGVKLHHCPLLLIKLSCRWSNDNNGNGQTKLSLLRSLNHLAFGWELTGRLPAYLKSGCDERVEGSEPFGLTDNESRADEWISGSIQKKIASHTICTSQLEEWFPCVCGFWSSWSLCNDCKKSCLNPPPWYSTDHFHLPSCIRGQSTMHEHDFNPAACTDLLKDPSEG